MNVYLIKKNCELLSYLAEVSWEAGKRAQDVLASLSEEDFLHDNVKKYGIQKIGENKFMEISTKEVGTEEEITNFINLNVAINKIELYLEEEL